MIIRFYKSTQPAALFLVPVLILALHIHLFFRSPFAYEGEAMPLYDLLVAGLKFFPDFMVHLFCVGLISSQAFHINYLVIKYEILYKKSFLPAFFYALIMGMYPDFSLMHPLLIVNSILLFVLERGFTLYKTETPLRTMFDLGFFISLATLIYFPCLTIFFGFGISLIFLRPFSFREWFSGLVGFVLPWFYTGIYYFWIDRLGDFGADIGGYFADLTGARVMFEFTLPVILPFFITFAILLLALWTLQSHFYKNVIRTRINQQVMFIFIAVAAISIFITKELHLFHFSMLAIPVATFVSYYFLAVKKRLLLELLAVIFISAIIYSHWQSIL